MIELGLFGKKLGHSFSKKWFEKKFDELNLEARYINFEINHVEQIRKIIDKHQNLIGFNVTIPYKKEIVQLLDDIDTKALETGAVNTVSIVKKNNTKKLIGYNTDIFGFAETFKPISYKNKTALIFGTGGAAKAVEQVLKTLGVNHSHVSRNGKLNYRNLDKHHVSNNKILINATPIGMYPHVFEKLPIPYSFIGHEHILVDLIYNPEETAFLLEGKKRGAKTVNGKLMLEKQAEASLNIWLNT